MMISRLYIYIIASMSFELQTQHENMNAYVKIIHLKKLFDMTR
jgi:hypothetical protein